MRTFSLALLTYFLPLCLSAQSPTDCPDCPCMLVEAKKMVKAENYDVAIRLYNAYKACDPSQSVIAEKGVLEVFNLIRVQRDEAVVARREADRQKSAAIKAQNDADNQRKRAEAREYEAARLARANSNALIALQTAKANPTLALRMAEMNYHLFPESKAAAGIFNEIIKDQKTQGFYKELIRKGHDLNVSDVKFSPDGRFLLSKGNCDPSEGVHDKLVLWNLDGIILQVFRKHSGSINSVTFSPDGKFILTGSSDSTAILWNLEGDILNTFRGHAGPINSVTFSPDGKFILTGSSDSTAILWNLDEGILNTFKGHTRSINTVAFSPSGEQILTGSSDSTAILWNLDEGILNTFKGHVGSINSVAFSPGGAQILTGSSDNSAILWSLDGQILNRLNGHSKSVHSVAFSPNGKQILTSSSDNSAIFWSSLQGSEIQRFSSIKNLTFSPDGNKILLIRGSDKAELWEIGGKLLTTYKWDIAPAESVIISPVGQHFLTSNYDNAVILRDSSGNDIKLLKLNSKSIPKTAFSPDGQYILTGSTDSIKLWNLAGKELLAIQGEESNPVAFSQDGKYIISGGTQVRVWNLEGQLIKSIRVNASSLSISPDGKYILTTSTKDYNARLWDFDGNEIKVFNGHTKSINDINFSPDGKLVVTAASDNTVRLWDLNGSLLYTFHQHSGNVITANFLPNGQNIVSNSSKEIIIWDLNGNIIQTIGIGHPFSFNDVAISPNGHSILTSDLLYSSIKHWNIKRSEFKEYISSTYYDFPFAFSPNNNYTLTGYNDGVAKLWSFKGEEINSFKGHSGPILDLCFSFDEKYILTGGNDSIATLWDIQGKKIRSFKGHNGAVIAVAFSPDSQYILTGSRDKTAKLWHIDGRLIQTFEGNPTWVESVAFSPEMNYIFTWIGDLDTRFPPKIWNFKGEEVKSFKKKGVKAILLSQDNKNVLFVSNDTTKQAVGSGIEIHSSLYKSDSNGKESALLLPGGRFFLIGNYQSATLWDLYGNEVLTIQGPRGYNFKYLGLSKDGRSIYSAKEAGRKLGNSLLPWAFLEEKVHSFSLEDLQFEFIELSFTQKDLELMHKRGKQW